MTRSRPAGYFTRRFFFTAEQPQPSSPEAQPEPPFLENARRYLRQAGTSRLAAATATTARESGVCQSDVMGEN